MTECEIENKGKNTTKITSDTLENIKNDDDSISMDENGIKTEFINVKNNNSPENENEIHFVDIESKNEDISQGSDERTEFLKTEIIIENVQKTPGLKYPKIGTEISKIFIEEHVEPRENVEKVGRKFKEKTIPCPYPGCKIKFAKPSKLKRHICMHTGERPFVCEYENCDKAYTNSSYLKRHKQTAHSEIKEQYPCKFCKLEFSAPHNLKRHCARFHDNPLSLCEPRGRQCDECDFSAHKRKDLLKHMLEEHNRKLYKCHSCSKSFSEPVRLKRHLNSNVHKIFSCKICFTVFGKHADFIQHKKEHIVVYTEFTCDICGKKFAHKNNLKLHIKDHDRLNIFVCSYENCDRVYYFQRNLDLHIRNYHLGAKWECHLCSAKLSSKQKLNGHIEKIHINPVPRKIITKKENRKKRWDIRLPKKSAVSQLCGITLTQEIEKKIMYRHEIKCDPFET